MSGHHWKGFQGQRSA